MINKATIYRLLNVNTYWACLSGAIRWVGPFADEGAILDWCADREIEDLRRKDGKDDIFRHPPRESITPEEYALVA